MMRINLVVVMVIGVFIMVCNADDSKMEDCLALCNQCFEVSDTLAHMECTKHCDELVQKEHGKITCSQLKAPTIGNPSLKKEINAYYAKASETIESGDYSALVQKFYTDDCVTVVDGLAPWFGREELKQAWIDWSKSNPTSKRILYTITAFGENNGHIWVDGIGNTYHDDALVGTYRLIDVFKRVDGILLIDIHVAFE
ncbi:uncharacterized protein [Amphiura filiformis]|uniref:uncharacterized protein n=1 Tax=Amphiura filiformis TaxID=82378 RepID=UPI003B21D046